MGILEKISEIEKEIARTQKNKGAEGGRGLRDPGPAGRQGPGRGRGGGLGVKGGLGL